jgi:hypothetical protein
MRKFFLFVTTLSLLLLISNTAVGQRWKTLRYEVMGGIGSTNIFGDIGGGASYQNWLGIKDLDFFSTRPSFWGGFRYKIRPFMAVRANLIYGFGAGADKNSLHEGRKLSFTTNLLEESVVYEYYFIPEEKRVKSAALYNRRGMLNNYSNIGVYAFAGIGGVLAIPKVTRDGLNVASDRFTGSGYHLVFPLGVGAKYVVDARWLVGAELGVRYSLSDGIDGYDAKIPANKANDIYYFGSINVSYRLKTTRAGMPLFLKNFLDNLKR